MPAPTTSQTASVLSSLQDKILLQAADLPDQKFVIGHIKVADDVKPQLPHILATMQDSGYLQAATNVVVGAHACSGQTLTTKGERRVDTLRGRSSAEIERHAADTALQSLERKSANLDGLVFEGVGAARRAMLLKAMQTNGELQRENGTGGQYMLGIEGERRLDALRGFDSKAIEHNAITAILEMAIKEGGVCAYTHIDGIGAARLKMLRKNLESAGHLHTDSVSFRGYAVEGHKITVKGERALDTLLGRDSAAVEKAGTLEILERAHSKGGVHSYMTFDNVGPARAAMLFELLQTKGDLEIATVRAGHIPMPCKRITEHGIATLVAGGIAVTTVTTIVKKGISVPSPVPHIGVQHVGQRLSATIPASRH